MIIQHSSIELTDLPNELLLMILNKLNNTQILYSLMGVHRRLDQIVCNSIFTRYLVLWNMSFAKKVSSLNKTMLDRFCLEILPLIHDRIKWLDLESSSMERILLAGRYPNLYGLGLVNIGEAIIERLFIGKKFHLNLNLISRYIFR